MSIFRNKGSDKKTVEYNYNYYYDNDIDYDKLAKAIDRVVNKNDKITEEKPTKNKITFLDFLKTVYYIIFNKKQSNGTLTSGIFGGLLTAIFNILAILGLIISIFGFVAIIITIKNCNWELTSIVDNISTIVFSGIILIIFLVFALLFRGAANEMAVEKDRNYIVSVFSSVVSFAALVVALVALFKEVV